MKIYSINWLGTEYPAIDITIFEDTPDEQRVTVSSTDLDASLIRYMEGSIVSDEATRLDESIAYYIDPSEFYLPENEIVKIVEESYQ